MHRKGTAMPSGRLLRRTVGAAAAAVALGLVGALGIGAAPATAATVTVTTTAPVITMQQPYLVALTDADPVQPQLTWYTNQTLDWTTITETVDATGLAALGTVTFGSECTASGLVATCQETVDAPSAGQAFTNSPFTLTATSSSKVGATGSYTVTGTLAGAVVKGRTARITVGGPDYQMPALGHYDNLKVGQTVSQPISFTDAGNRPSAATELSLQLTPGLRFAHHYANCRYRTLVHNGVSYEDLALCQFNRPMLIGEQDALAEPVVTVTTRQAMWDYVDASIAPAGDQAAFWWVTVPEAGATWAQGTGATLGLKRLVAGTPSTAPAGTAEFPFDNNGYQIEFLTTNNTADYGVTGSSAHASAGQDVTMSFTVTNHGPAALDDRSGGDATPGVQVTPPPGTTVVTESVPQASFAYPGDSFRYTVTLHVDTVVPHATGTLQLVYPPNSSPVIPFDPNPANNTASLVLN